MFDVVVLKYLGSQNLMVQVGGFVAKRGASVLKRRKSRNRMERSQTSTGASGAAAGQQEQQTPNTPNTVESQLSKSESDGDVVFYTEEPRAGKAITIMIVITLTLFATPSMQEV